MQRLRGGYAKCTAAYAQRSLREGAYAKPTRDSADWTIAHAADGSRMVPFKKNMLKWWSEAPDSCGLAFPAWWGQRPDGRVTRKQWKIMATQPLIEDFRSKNGGETWDRLS